METKAALRTRMKALRDAIPPEVRAADARRAVDRLLALPELSGHAVSGRCVTLYHAIRSELDATSAFAPLARRGARILLPILFPDPDGVPSLAFGEVPPEIALAVDDEPQVLADWLEPGIFGLKEPSRGSLVSLDELRRGTACVVAPGLAYDPRGYRLGWGKGYYDGFLGRLGPQVPVVALAFEAQLLDDPLPNAPHDVPVDLIVTPERVLVPQR